MHGPPRTGRKDGRDKPGHRGPDGRTDWTYRVTSDRTEGRKDAERRYISQI